MSSGKGIAYQSYKPLQGDITSDLLNAEDQEFKHRHEKRIEDDRRAKSIAQKEAARKAGLKRVKHVDLFDTGSDTLNGTIAETVRLAQQEYPKIFEILDSPDKYSLKEQTEAQLKLSYLNDGGLVNDLKTMTNSVMSEYQGYEKALSNNQIFRDEDFEKKFENGYKGVTLSLDDNLRPVALFKNTGMDENGDGILDVETMDSLNDVYSRPQFQPNYNYDSMVKQHSDKLVSAVNQTDNGIRKTKTTGVETDLLKDTVERFLYNKDGTPTGPMKAFARQRGLDINNPNDLKSIENDYLNDIYLRTNRGKVTDVDGSTALANRKYNDKEEKVSLSEVTSPTKKTYSIYDGNIDKSNVNSIGISGNVTIPSVKTEKGDFVTNLNPHNITRDKFGRLIVEGSYQATKSETITEKQKTELEESANSGNTSDQQILATLLAGDDGKYTVSKPGTKKRKDITVSKEDEILIANTLGYSVEELNERIYKQSNDFDWSKQ